MNLVLDDAEEVLVKKKSRKHLGASLLCVLCLSAHENSFVCLLPTGRIMLKGDTITLMQPAKALA